MTLEDMFPHAEVVRDAVDAGTAAELRASIQSYRRYALLDRGSYEVADVSATPAFERALLKVLGVASERLGGRALVAMEARAIRLTEGDYLLARHDKPVEERCVELVLDLSPTPVQAEIQYRRLGNVFFRVPCSPRSLAIVERTPVVTSNHTYVSKLRLGVEIVRLIVQARYTA